MTAGKKPPKIFYPCSSCVHGDDCREKRGCYAWKAWFRAYWRALRLKHLGKGGR